MSQFESGYILPHAVREVLVFWFEELQPKQHWQKDPQLDAAITRRFGILQHKACMAELWAWRESAEGRLAEIILLDQFSRNIFRDTPAAFAGDPMALVLAQEAVRLGVDQHFEVEQRKFIYMPYMHSESLAVHDEALKLFEQEGLEDNYRFEILHREIIERFGRYPHRNDLLGRSSTEEELAFLQQPGSSF